MGLLDKIKGLGRAISGGGAEVSLDVSEATIGGVVEAVVHAKVADADLAIDGVYLLVRGCEEIRVDGVQLRNRMSQVASEVDPQAPVADEVFMSETYDVRVDIAEAQKLEANGEYEWRGQVLVPADALPTYIGRRCAHTWRIQGGLDAFGNDPDSGWIEFVVR